MTDTKAVKPLSPYAARKQRNLWLAFALVAAVVLIFVVTVARMSHAHG